MASWKSPIRAVVGLGTRSVRRVRSTDASWRIGLDDETRFWDGVIKRGGNRREVFLAKLDPDTPLADRVVRHLPDGEHIKILDVGAGPLTTVGKRCPGRTLEIHATDALADRYDAMLADAGIVPPVRTVKCETENLATLFDAETFDVVCATNTLDHHYDPIAAMRAMLEVTRPGGVLILAHKENEGAKAHYNGLHQFNFTLDEGRPRLWNQRMSVFVDDIFGPAATRVHSELGHDDKGSASVLMVYRKNERPVPST